MRCLLVFLLLTAVTEAETIDPDQFPDGTDISTAWPGVRLELEDRVPGSPNVGEWIWSMDGLSSTGDRSFAYRIEDQDPLGRLFGSFDFGMLLSVEFDADVESVWIDTIQDNQGNTRGWMQAYDSGFGFLEEALSPVMSERGDIETVEIHRSTNEIKYVYAGSVGDGVRLDNFRYSTAHIPEPSTLVFCAALCACFAGWLVSYTLGRTRS